MVLGARKNTDKSTVHPQATPENSTCKKEAPHTLSF